MEITSLTVGPVGTNAYILTDPNTKECLLADPGAEPERISRYLRQHQLKPAAILLTHGHFDHIQAVPQLAEEFDLSVYGGAGDLPLFEDPEKSSAGLFFSRACFTPQVLLKEGDRFTLAGLSFRVLETPGHTPGGCCFYFEREKILLSGDTLFQESYGRTDLPGGDFRKMCGSVRRLLTELPSDTAVYPGHGEATDILSEQRCNPLAVML